MLGYPTIIIPAIQGGDGRKPNSDEQFQLNTEQIAWISNNQANNTSAIYSRRPHQHILKNQINFFFLQRFYKFAMCTTWMLYVWLYNRTDWQTPRNAGEIQKKSINNSCHRKNHECS